MRFAFKRFLLTAFIGILVINIALTTKAMLNKSEPVRVIAPHEQIADSTYVISEKAIMSKLTMKSQIVSLEQQLDKKSTFVDDGFFGQRHTDLKLHGKYKMGLETKDIVINHIDSENRILYIDLPNPILISLELPFDKIEFSKTQGWLRLAVDEEEEKKYYIAAEKSIKEELMSDKELMKQVNIFNESAVSGLLKMTGIKEVIFQ